MMRTAPPVFREDAARHVTLAAQTQAVERAIQAMHTHLHEVLTPRRSGLGGLFPSPIPKASACPVYHTPLAGCVSAQWHG